MYDAGLACCMAAGTDHDLAGVVSTRADAAIEARRALARHRAHRSNCTLKKADSEIRGGLVFIGQIAEIDVSR